MERKLVFGKAMGIDKIGHLLPNLRAQMRLYRDEGGRPRDPRLITCRRAASWYQCCYLAWPILPESCLTITEEGSHRIQGSLVRHPI